MNTAQKSTVLIIYLYPLLLKEYQTGFGAHPASYPMGTGVFFPRG